MNYSCNGMNWIGKLQQLVPLGYSMLIHGSQQTKGVQTSETHRCIW